MHESTLFHIGVFVCLVVIGNALRGIRDAILGAPIAVQTSLNRGMVVSLGSAPKLEKPCTLCESRECEPGSFTCRECSPANVI